MSADDAAIDPHQLLDCDDVAALLKVSRKWVEDKVAGDEIPYTRIGPRLIRFTRDDLDVLFSSGRHDPTRLPGRRPVVQPARVASVRRRKAA
jgi:excisionase family DNA binding protein